MRYVLSGTSWCSLTINASWRQVRQHDGLSYMNILQQELIKFKCHCSSYRWPPDFSLWCHSDCVSGLKSKSCSEFFSIMSVMSKIPVFAGFRKKTAWNFSVFSFCVFALGSLLLSSFLPYKTRGSRFEPHEIQWWMCPWGSPWEVGCAHPVCSSLSEEEVVLLCNQRQQSEARWHWKQAGKFLIPPGMFPKSIVQLSWIVFSYFYSIK